MFKYMHIVEDIRQEIISGVYKPGEKLPSVQSLTRKQVVNADTVLKAYKLLEEEHYIYAVPRSGYYVVKSVLVPKEGVASIDMINVKPPDEINPYKDFNHCMKKAELLYGHRLYDYASPQGMEELRKIICKYLLRAHILTTPGDIVITNGAQQALYIIAMMKFNRCDKECTKVLVEQPTYHLMLQILEKNQIPVEGIRRSKEGIDLAELEDKFRSGDIKFFYTMPRYQNPTGYSYNKTERLEICKLAKKYNVYIVEDDYLADLEIDSKADSLFIAGESEQVIYIRSFSKTLLPGLRLGMVVLPSLLKEEFIKMKQLIDLNTTTITQGALEIYLKSGMYESHLRKLQEYYRAKMKYLKEICDQYLGDEKDIYIPQTGIYASLFLSHISSKYLKDKLDKNKIYTTLLDDNFIKNTFHPSGIRLCLCNASKEDLELVIRLIGTEIHKNFNSTI